MSSFFFFFTKSSIEMMNGWHLCRVVVRGQRGSADCLLLSWFYMLSMYGRTELNTVGAAGWKNAEISLTSCSPENQSLYCFLSQLNFDHFSLKMWVNSSFFQL